MTNEKTIAVLIPCYNEALTIKNVIRDYQKVYPSARIYVYDNNSIDDTSIIAKKAGAIVKKERKQGKGNVLRAMFHDIEADCYLLTDGDCTYPAQDTLSLVNAVCMEGVDMAIGDRLSSTYFSENKRPFHNFGNRLVRGLINTMFGARIKDVMTGSRALSHKFVKNFPVMSSCFEIETEMTIHALDKQFIIEEYPIEYRDRPEGSVSKLNTFSDGWRVLKTICRLLCDYRPLLFFSIIAGIVGCIGISLSIPVFTEYFQTGLVPRFPTLIVGCFIILFSLMLLSTGIVLDSIQRKHRILYTLLLK